MTTTNTRGAAGGGREFRPRVLVDVTRRPSRAARASRGASRLEPRVVRGKRPHGKGEGPTREAASCGGFVHNTLDQTLRDFSLDCSTVSSLDGSNAKKLKLNGRSGTLSSEGRGAPGAQTAPRPRARRRSSTLARTRERTSSRPAACVVPGTLRLRGFLGIAERNGNGTFSAACSFPETPWRSCTWSARSWGRWGSRIGTSSARYDRDWCRARARPHVPPLPPRARPSRANVSNPR